MNKGIIIGAAIYLGLRIGLFGKCRLRLSPEDKDESVTNFIIFHYAEWQPYDCYVRVYCKSLRPIEFVRD
jgi:hypothetical protein